MFTGIIAAVGKVATTERRGEDMRLTIDAGTLDLRDAHIGDSIAVNGICLTVVTFVPPRFSADVSLETLQRTTLGDWNAGTLVNLELALRPLDRLGGHLVSGHVDSVATVQAKAAVGRSHEFRFRVPAGIARYIAEKGSICVDGVSLTVNAVTNDEFSVNIVPHTLSATAFSTLAPGRKVNIEVDMLARYIERLLSGSSDCTAPSLSLALLKEYGFLK